ncbi:ATP-binding protein [Portibacter marinus]|uniref:ATP-binding protein n=1 Tax=Portibacter marinus TaxID=2898660 RepID=UPI001F19003C|nr:DUF87 domain-containing protein [Portibacter marinus]
MQLPPEKMGAFFLGAEYDIKNKELTAEPVIYDARDLTTHAVCVGMTGSGKTGLCIGLLEEAAIDQVPALIIDPKGDMTNLLLQFEDLSPSDFEKWINPDDASRKGMTISDYAAKTAETWRNGLASWGEDEKRIKLLKESVDYTIYTPGSDSGVPINILGSFAAPGVDFDSDTEMLRERIQGTVAALLGMIESKEDPVRSREGILLATLFEHYWRNDEDLDLTKLIMGIQNPPFNKLGVFDIDTFFPEKDRFDLALQFNTLVASPQFQYWLQGAALDIDKLYFTPEGKIRHSIMYIAHLSDSERMFFVTLLLNSLISWMRRQSGTTSLRSLLYFDEIFGYFPPTAQPPSKRPLLTILKQARAFGVGAVLVTQNPVDIDYKGLSNAGTWFIGKLQTERDKARVLQGLEGAIQEAGSSVKTDFGQLISSLGSRVFLLHNVHEDQPVVMHTRWVMSYLRGPMTRPQVKELMKEKKQSIKSVSKSRLSPNPQESIDIKKATEHPPSLNSDIKQMFLPVWKSASEASSESGMTDLNLIYEGCGFVNGDVRFYDAKRHVDEVTSVAFLTPPPDDFGRIDWDSIQAIDNWKKKLYEEPDYPDSVEVAFADTPESMNTLKEFKHIEKEFSDFLYQSQSMPILVHEKFEIYQVPNEGRESFHSKVTQLAREERDKEIDELRERYEEKFDRIKDRIRDEEQDLYEHEAELKDRRTAEIIGVAETIFSVFKGRRRSFSSASTKSRMRRKASQRIEATRMDLEELHEDYQELERELQEKIEEVKDKWEKVSADITVYEVKPRRTDVNVNKVLLVWHPYWVAKNGHKVSAVE